MPTASAVAVSPAEKVTPVEGAAWCVAVVKRGSEKMVRDDLKKHGIVAYVATQTLRVQYAKRRPKDVEYVRLPAKVFIQQTFVGHTEREQFRSRFPAITSFMPDPAMKKDDQGRIPLAMVPDADLRRMRYWLDDTEHEVTIGIPDATFSLGDMVRVVGTRFDGEIGRVASKDTKTYIVLEIAGLSWATIQFSSRHLTPLLPKKIPSK